MNLLVGASLGASLSGVVREPSGAPLEGVVVTVYDERLAYASARTDDSGAWSIAGLPAARYRVRAVALDQPYADRFLPGVWDYCPAEVLRLEEDEQVRDLDFVLPPAGALEGRVLDSLGDPVADILLTCEGAEGRTALIQREAVSDVDGAFACVGLDASAEGSLYSLHAEGEGWPDQYLGGVYRENEGVEEVLVRLEESAQTGDFVLLEGIRVSGSVLSDEEPVAGAFVHV